MKLKKGLIFICFIVCLFTIASISASDVNETFLADENQIITENDDSLASVEQENVGAGENEELDASTGTIADLANEIANAGDELNLTRDYVYSYDIDGDTYMNGTDIEKKITINGNGFTVRKEMGYGFFNVFADDVTICGLNFVGQNVIYGDANNLKLINCSFVNCSDGSFISMHGDNCVISNCSFTNCFSGYDGAIFWNGHNGCISECNFVNCHAETSGGAIYAWHWDNIVNLNISRCNFTDCHAKTSGGAIYAEYYANLDILRSNFFNCRAGEYGGAIYCSQGDLINVYECNFTNNSAKYGNAIYCYDTNGKISDSDVRFEDIFDVENNLKIVNITDAMDPIGTFTDLVKEIANAGDELNLTRNYVYSPDVDWRYFNGTFIEKKITINGNGFTISKDGVMGALIFHADDVTLNNLNFVGPEFISGWGNNLQVVNCNFVNSSEGSFIYIEGDNSIVSNCSFINCFSEYYGAINWNGYNGRISECNFVNCHADKCGGAIYVDSWNNINNLNISRCIFTSCSAGENGGAIYGDYNENLNVFDSNFTDCHAGGDGGAIYWQKGRIVVSNCNFENNSASVGNAIYFTGKNGKLIDSNVVNEDIFDMANFKELKNSSILINAKEYNYGEIPIIGYNLTQNATGNLSVYVDNTLIKVVNVSDEIQLHSFDPGDYLIKVVYNGDSIYDSCEDTLNLKINKATPYFSVYVNPIEGNTKFRFSVDGNVSEFCDCDVSGELTFCINDCSYYFMVADYSNFIALNDLIAGDYNYSAHYSGNSKYASVTLEDNISILPAESHIEIFSSDIIIGETAVIYYNITGNPTGWLDVYVNCSLQTTVRVGDPIEINDLQFGSYYISVELLQGGFEISQDACAINVIKETPEIIISNDTQAGRNSILKIILNEDATSSIAVNIDDTIYYGNVTNGITIIPVYNLTGGIHNASINYYGNYKYNQRLVYNSFEVKLLNSYVLLPTYEINFGESINILPFVSPNANGVISLYIDGNFMKDLSISESYNLSGLNAGNYTIKASYLGDEYYIGCENTTTLKVNKINTTISVSPVSVTAGNVALTIILNNKATGNVTVNVNNKNYTRALSDGKTTIYIQDLPFGDYNYTLYYSGDYNFNSMDLFNNISVILMDLAIVCDSSDIFVDETAIVCYNLTENATGILSVYVNETFMKNLTVGEIIELDNLSAGLYNISVVYNSNGFFDTCQGTVIINVIKRTPEIVIGNDTQAGRNSTVKIVLNEDATGNITLDIDGAIYYGNVTGGIAIIPVYNLTGGLHNVSIDYSGNYKYNQTLLNTSFEVKVLEPSVLLPTHEIDYGESIDIIPIVSPNATGNVSLYINDNFIKYLSIFESYKLSGLNAGNYTIKAVYSGDEYYAECENETELTVNKINTTISVSHVSSTAGNVALTVTLNNKATGNVTVNVNNKNYTKTLSNGRATIYIYDLPSGYYNYAIAYSGDGNFNGNNVARNINVQPIQSSITISSNDIYVGDVARISYSLTNGATGNLSVYANDIFIKDVAVGMNIELDNLAFGDYTVKVIYNTDGYYASCQGTDSFKVKKLNPTFSVSVNGQIYDDYEYPDTNIYAGSDVNFVFIFNSDIDGEINVTHEIDHTLKLVNGRANMTVSDVVAGYHYFTVDYVGDNKYLPFHGEIQVYFEYIPTSIEYTIPSNLLWGDSFIINPILPNGATGEIEITVYDNKGYYFNDVVDVGSSYNFTILNGGKNYLKLYYEGDEYYDGCSYLEEFNVAKLNTTCTITESVEAGYYPEITVTLNEDVKGSIDVLLNNGHYSDSLVNGSYVFSPYTLKAGTYDVTINYLGDSKYNSFMKIKTLNVTLKKTTLSLDIDNIIYGSNMVFNPDIVSGATGYINIYVDGQFKQKIQIGSSYTLTKPEIGKHEVRIVYASDGYFQNCENTSSFWVFSKYPIESRDTFVIYNSGNFFKAKFFNEYGNPLANKYVVFSVGGNDYARLTDNLGWATLDLNLEIGTYDITSINTVYNEDIVNRLVVYTSVESHDLIRAYNSGIDFNATFLDNAAKPLSNTYVVFKINQFDYTVKTNMEGQAVLNVPLGIGTYTVVSINTLTSENKTNALTIVPSVQASDMVRAYNSTMDYKATFMDGSGNYLSNHAVRFKIGNVTYDATTDNRGVAILNVLLGVGEYNVTAINPITNEESTKKLSIVERIIEDGDMITFTDVSDYYKVKIVDDDGSICGKGHKVVFKFNNANFNVETDSSGYAKLLISSLAKGKYPISVSYKGFTVNHSVMVFKELESIISIDVEDINYTQQATIKVSVVPEHSVGNISVNIIGSNGYDVEFNQSAKLTFNKVLNGLNASDYSVAVKFRDDYNYYMSHETAVFKVSKINPNIILVVDNAQFSQNATITINIPQVSGNITIKIGENRIYNEFIPKDGVIIKRINDLGIGDYDVAVIYDGDENYNPLTKVNKLNITKISTEVSLNSLYEFDYGQEIVIDVVASVEGKVKVQFGDDIRQVDVDANKVYHLKYYYCDAAYYPIVATLTPSNNIYDISFDESVIKINPVDSNMQVYAKDIEFGQPTDISVVLNANASGLIELEYDNHYYYQNITNGKAAFNLAGFKIGDYSLNVVYDGDINFKESKGLANFKVTKIKSYSIDIPGVIDDNDINLVISLPVNATGNVTMVIDGKKYDANVFNGQAIVNLSSLTNGDYAFDFIYGGDAVYSSFTTNGVLKIDRDLVAPEIVIPPLDNPSDEGIISVKLPSDAKGTVTLTIGGKDYPFEVIDGIANVVIPKIDGGNYPYTISYSGDSKYSSFVNTGRVDIPYTGTVNAKDMTVTYGGGYDFIATFFKADGSVLSDSYVVFNVMGKDNVVKTDSNGVAILNIGLGNGVYNVTSTNLITGESVKNVLTIVGQPIPIVNTVILAASMSTVYGEAKYLITTLKDITGKALTGVQLSVNLNGVKYFTTDSNGQIRLSTNGLIPNEYDVAIKFDGNANYASSVVSVKVIVNKATPKITAKAKTFKVKVKTKKYSITLKNNEGKSINKAKLILKVKGKTYKATTNSKGKATFKITKLTKKGSYKAVITFNGDKFYKKVSKKVKITIKK